MRAARGRRGRAEVEDCRKKIESLKTELQIIGREGAIGVDIGSRESDANDSLKAEQDRLTEIETRWNSEKILVDQIRSGSIVDGMIAADPFLNVVHFEAGLVVKKRREQ